VCLPPSFFVFILLPLSSPAGRCPHLYSLEVVSNTQLYEKLVEEVHGPNSTCTGGLYDKNCSAKGLKLPYLQNQTRRNLRLARRLRHPAVNGTIEPTPWLRIQQDYAFYGNQYLDFFIYAFFFSGMYPPSSLVTNGVYIEIGGSNGIHASNTLFFETHLNWKGFLIEPSACGRCMLPFTRPRDHVRNAGACTVATKLPGEFMTSFCPFPQDRCVRDAPGGYKNYSVPCLPMRDLLATAPTHVHFISIDVEQHFKEVLTTLPWDRMAIDVILLECSDKAWCSGYLTQRGYHIAAFSLDSDLVAVRKECVTSSRT